MHVRISYSLGKHCSISPSRCVIICNNNVLLANLKNILSRNNGFSKESYTIPQVGKLHSDIVCDSKQNNN